MKLAMIIEAWHPIWWWGQAVAENLARYLSEKQNCKVDLYVMNLSWKKDNWYEKVNENFNIIYVWKKRTFWFIDRLLWCIDLIKLVKENNKTEKYSHIFAHANLPWIPASILSKKLKIPSIYQVHWSWIDAMKKMYWNNIKSKILFFIENYIQTKIRYDLQITVDKKFLERENINKSFYIANWADIKKFDKIKNIKKENKNWLNFIFVWRLHPQKWLHYLVESVNLIKNKLDDTKFVIIWEWEEEVLLKNKIKRCSIESFFEFRWKKTWDDLIKEFKKSDIFILPSLFEWFPLTLLEAWSSKLPVLVTKVWENPNVVIDWENWFLINPWDSKELAKSIENILKTSKNDLEENWKKWYELVKENYSLDSINLEIFNKIRKVNANKN
jgi:glycosyltransferase involved in cell wall biosynthesis